MRVTRWSAIARVVAGLANPTMANTQKVRRVKRMARLLVQISCVAWVVGVALAAPAAAATLKVSSFPSGAQVLVDGVNTGKITPMNVSLAEGDHAITVQIPGSGWQPDTRTVTIGPGNNDLSVTLLPQLTSGPPGPKGDKGDKGDNGDRATRADGPCLDNANRYVNCQNGTVTDTVTGLIWLQQADCLPSAQWVAANQAAAGLKDGDCGLTDGSSPGDWRLPSADEWTATIASAIACIGPHGPSLMNDAGTSCQAVGPSSFAGVAADLYWSSSTYKFSSGIDAAIAFLDLGDVGSGLKTPIWRVWPVRGGPR